MENPMQIPRKIIPTPKQFLKANLTFRHTPTGKIYRGTGYFRAGECEAILTEDRRIVFLPWSYDLTTPFSTESVPLWG